MSEENVEVVRRIYEALNETGEPPVGFGAPNYEFDASDVMPDMPPSRGQEEAVRMFRSYSEMFDDFTVTLEEVIAADNECVVTSVTDGGRMKGSDAEVWNRFFHVFTLRNGKVTRWSSHLTRERALEAAGLSE